MGKCMVHVYITGFYCAVLHVRVRVCVCVQFYYRPVFMADPTSIYTLSIAYTKEYNIISTLSKALVRLSFAGWGCKLAGLERWDSIR